jgi:hypothetical protein
MHHRANLGCIEMSLLNRSPAPQDSNTYYSIKENRRKTSERIAYLGCMVPSLLTRSPATQSRQMLPPQLQGRGALQAGTATAFMVVIPCITGRSSMLHRVWIAFAEL